ncbi:MAG: LysE family transporter [Chitinophagales bacterium]|nr:LysE family transporter [Chitinophagales bacterium]
MTLSIALVYLLGLISPGPDFVMCVKNSLQYNRTTGRYTALGFGLGILVHIAYSFLGIAYLISTNKNIFIIIQLLGALYLLYMGIGAIKNANTTFQINEQHQNKQGLSAIQAIKSGFLTNILNPKATLFFLSIFTVIQTKQVPLLNSILLSIFFVIATITWFYIVATLITHHKFQSRIIRYSHYINKLLGIILIFISLEILYTVIKNFV